MNESKLNKMFGKYLKSPVQYDEAALKSAATYAMSMGKKDGRDVISAFKKSGFTVMDNNRPWNGKITKSSDPMSFMIKDNKSGEMIPDKVLKIIHYDKPDGTYTIMCEIWDKKRFDRMGMGQGI